MRLEFETTRPQHMHTADSRATTVVRKQAATAGTAEREKYRCSTIAGTLTPRGDRRKVCRLPNIHIWSSLGGRDCLS